MRELDAVTLCRSQPFDTPEGDFYFPCALGDCVGLATHDVIAFASFFRSSIGRKMIVAITGLVLLFFIIGHLLGNLQIFLGPDWINAYAQHLRDWEAVLWIVRVVLIVSVVLHIYYTIALTIDNRRARGDYREKDYAKATFASRYMWLSGLVVLAFVIYHLAHFTFVVADPRLAHLHPDALNRRDVFSMMVYGFRVPIVSIFYLVAIFLLMLHLTHGASSFFQSLGLNDKKLTPKLARGGRIFAWLIFIGYASIPIAVLLGFVQPAQSL